MNGIAGKIVFFVPFIIIIAIAVWAIFFLDSDENRAEVTYDSEGGIISIEFEDPLADAAWTARVTYETTSSSGSIIEHVVIDDAPAVLSTDLRTATITDPSLVNLENWRYDVLLTAPGQHSHELWFEATGHVFTTEEIVVIVLVVLLFVAVLGFLIARRIIFGGKMSWSWSKRIH